MEMTEREDLWSAMTENELLANVLEMADGYGWAHYHVFEQRPYAKRSSKGFPDLVMVRGDQLHFIELKDQKGQATVDQEGWLTRLFQVQREVEFNVHVGLWRPSDWYTGIIEQVLDHTSINWIEQRETEEDTY